ncbi:hypothetical protein Ciccas_009874 [Cichlidogyrus casuarinus]|uniref:Uncharacterized protein n=1 Tax=Cichlidogyrus casuarinus TaxID=1844966 RepID=A0ABD2PW86_9PLAT
MKLHYLRVIGWIALVSCTQFLAIFIRRIYPDCAKAILTWITRPLLLLSAILMVTLGIYINHYIIHHMDRMLMISLLLEVSTSFLIGWIVGYFFGEGVSSARTLSTEAAFSNGLLAIVILRTSLHTPDGDLAAMAGFWMTFIMPVAGVFHAMIDISTDTVKNWLNKKDEDSLDTSDDLGATTMAAISAASVAVTPAIANMDKKTKKKEMCKEDDSDDTDPLKSNNRLSRPRRKMSKNKTKEEINYALLNQSIGSSDRTCQMYENGSKNKKSNSFCVNTTGSCKTEMV